MVLSPISGLASFSVKPGKYKRLDHPGRAGKPAVAHPADADAEVGAIAGHDGDNRAAFNPLGGVGDALAGGHHRVEDAERIFAQELDHVRGGCLVLGYPGNRGGQGGCIEQGGSIQAVMSIIAHVQRFGDQRADVHSAGSLDRVVEQRAQDVVHPLELGDDFRAVGAHAQHFPAAFVQAGERFVPVGFILDDVYQHRRRNQAGHRPDCSMVVAGLELDLARLYQGFCFSRVFRLSFKDERAVDRALHRAGHPVPGNRGTRVQEQVGPHPGDDIDRFPDPNQHGAGFHHEFNCPRIGFFDIDHSGSSKKLPLRLGQAQPRAAVVLLLHSLQNRHQLLIPTCRGTPIDMDGGDTLGHQVFGEGFQADIDG